MTDTVLIVDDDPAMCHMLESGLASSRFDTVSAGSADAALEVLTTREITVVITDLRMRKVDGFELCRRIVENRPDIPVVVITAFGSMEAAIEAIRAGAYDFITKPFGLDTIRITVQRAARHRALSRRVELLEQALDQTHEIESIVGSSPPICQLRDLIKRAARSNTPVLITGESGTGKELVARALHHHGARNRAPFIAINCAAVPESLLESELFGHAKGAFTDARTDRVGLFAQAEGGTLFLDEIGELPLGLQPKLLRALQEHRVRPLGGTTEVPFDARIVAATNRDLETEVAEGRFRQDLFFRIHVLEIVTPPLRLCGNDILTLAQRFIERFALTQDKRIIGMMPATAEKLLAYPWPGNVRELQNALERAVTLCLHDRITVADLPSKVRDYDRSRLVLSMEPSDMVPMEEVERRYVTYVYEASNGNKSLAAKILGFNRKTLYRKLRRYGVLRDDDTGLP
jgi:DNA-binding NtrC family response regulator